MVKALNYEAVQEAKVSIHVTIRVVRRCIHMGEIGDFYFVQEAVGIKMIHFQNQEIPEKILHSNYGVLGGKNSPKGVRDRDKVKVHEVQAVCRIA